MVKCRNCEHLITVCSCRPSKDMLFEKEYLRCQVKGIDFKMYYEVQEERECQEYKEGRYWKKK